MFISYFLSFNYTDPSPSLVYFFLTIHLFYSTNPLPPAPPPPALHLYTDVYLMSSTEVKTYRKERKKEKKVDLFLHKMCCKMVWKFCEIWNFLWELASRWAKFWEILIHSVRYGMYAYVLILIMLKQIVNSKDFPLYSSSQMHLYVMFLLFPENWKSIP